MRKTLFAMVGLLALGVWALPALAGDTDPPLREEITSPENRAGRLGAVVRGTEAAANLYKGTLSGTLIKQTQATTSWYLYPGACAQRAGGTWVPYTAGPVSDSLNTYDPTTQNHGYQVEDQSLKEILWHIDDGVGKDVSNGPWPLPIDGARSLWCGKTDPNFKNKSGYPNLTFQILYFDTDLSAAGGGAARSGAYTLSWSQYVSSEFNYDWMYVIAGSGGKDPVGNSRVALDAITSSGSDATGELLITFTGSQDTNQTLAYTPGGVTVLGNGGAQPVLSTVSMSNIPSYARAIYFLFHSDCLFSSEDGLWPFGHGAVLDLVGTSDQGLLYDDQSAAGGVDSFSGNVLVGTPGNPLISARVAPGVGTLWQLVFGDAVPTSDICSPAKSTHADHMFFGADASLKTTIPNTFASIRICSLPVPVGTAQILALDDEYIDLPRQSGFAQWSEYRSRKLPGPWSSWNNSNNSNVVQTGGRQAWGFQHAYDLTTATQADSVQIRYNLQCINAFAIDGVNCQSVTYGVLYDDFRLQILTGVPAPIFSIFGGSIPMTHFVDGSDPGTPVACTAAQISASQCWPGIRGSDPAVGGLGAIHDNVNASLGDSIVVNFTTGLRQNGMGINWRQGFDRTVNTGLTIAHTNQRFNPAVDVPRMIYRLFDPTTKAWSPWDSTEMDADAVSISGADTTVIGSAYRMNWPPRDKLAAAASLPGGFSLNGKTAYSALAFLPQGCRMQYYFKATDVNGGVSYQFTADNLSLEVEDLPALPGTTLKAPDILEWDVLPRVYPAGAGGTLLAGVTDAKILNLDNTFSTWSFAQDPITQALRAMGVRADRFRQGNALDEGNGIGGHELPGVRPRRFSNYIPNLFEYGILTKLANQYRIIIQSSHLHTTTAFEEQDAKLVHNWWNTDTGLDGGDRCIFLSGDDAFNALLNASLSFPNHTEQVSLSQDVFGVASAVGAWSGTATNAYPTVTDAFAGISYPVDGGCPGPNRFDGLVKGGSPDITTAATYPSGTEAAGLARMTENDATGSTDNDRSKALGYGFSIQYIRKAGIANTAANYVHSGVENRMLVLYKFLTSCRGQRTPGMTNVCWPCPSNASDLVGNWAAAGTNFNTALSGPLYAIQDNTQATGVELVDVPKVNRLEGNFPNPFNPETAIRFTAATPGMVTIRVFDVAGRVVNTLSKNVTEAGINEVRWNGKSQDGRALASGVYFYKIRFVNGQESEAKMTLLK